MNRPILKVAYAEMHIAVRKGIISLLEKSGDIKFILEASKGNELLNLLERTKELPDLCILDVNLPELNGFDTVVEIKKRWPNVGILILTSFSNDMYIHRMILNGANGYLTKTSSPEEIKEALFTIHRDGLYFTTTITKSYFRSIQSNTIKIQEFTDRELQVLKYSCTDLSYEEIAAKMNTTKRSVEGYRDSLFKKLNLNSRVSLAIFAIKYGLVPMEINHSYS